MNFKNCVYISWKIQILTILHCKITQIFTKNYYLLSKFSKFHNLESHFFELLTSRAPPFQKINRNPLNQVTFRQNSSYCFFLNNRSHVTGTVLNMTLKGYMIFYSIFCQKPNFAKNSHQCFHKFFDARLATFISSWVKHNQKNRQIIAGNFFIFFTFSTV